MTELFTENPVVIVIIGLGVLALLSIFFSTKGTKKTGANIHNAHDTEEEAGETTHHGTHHADHGPDIEQLRKEAANASKGRGVVKFFIVCVLVIVAIVLYLTKAPEWTLALLGFITIYTIVDSVFGPVNKWVNVGFLVLGILLVTSIFTGRPMELTYLQERVSTKQSEEEKSSEAETPSRQLPGVAVMTITPYGSFYTNLIPGVVYNVPNTINSRELITVAGGNDVEVGLKNPLVAQKISSEKSTYWFTKERVRLKNSADKELIVYLTPIRWEDAQ